MAMINISQMNKEEQKIIEKAKFDYIESKGTKQIKDCIIDAIYPILHLNESQFYSLFGIYVSDYVNNLLEKVGDLNGKIQ